MAGVDCEIMTVTERPLNTHLKKAIRDFKGENPTYYMENYSFRKFIIEFPKHELMDKHEIVSNDELKKLLFTLKTQKNKLPKMSSKDTGAVWIGIHPGQVVRIYRTSETAGMAIAYRVIK